MIIYWNAKPFNDGDGGDLNPRLFRQIMIMRESQMKGGWAKMAQTSSLHQIQINRMHLVVNIYVNIPSYIYIINSQPVIYMLSSSLHHQYSHGSPLHSIKPVPNLQHSWVGAIQLTGMLYHYDMVWYCTTKVWCGGSNSTN